MIKSKFVKCIQFDPKAAALQFKQLISLKYIERGELIFFTWQFLVEDIKSLYLTLH